MKYGDNISYGPYLFFGFTELTLNETTQRLEVTYQFTAHHFENAIAELNQEQ
jgi:hypothetical protein